MCETTWLDIGTESDLEITLDVTADGRFSRAYFISNL